MLRRSEIVGLALLPVLGCALNAPVSVAQAVQPAQASLHAPAPSPTTAVRRSNPHTKKKPEPAAEVPQTPPPPPTLEQQPPSAPQVTYKNGQLSIDSRNATLSQVLRSVQAQTGAAVDLPPGAGSERVVATLGPGQPKDVLATLLNGSKFNYVILGEANNPGAVQKVILMARTGGASGASPSTTAQNTPPPPQQAVEPPEEDYQQANEPEIENQNQSMPGQPAPSDADNPGLVNPAGRTPEQMLQELQRIQQQQQQMQQQLNPANQQPPQQPLTPGQPLSSRPQPQ